MLPGLQGLIAERRATGQQSGDVGGHVLRNVCPQLVDRDHAVGPGTEHVSRYHAQPEGFVVRRTLQPVCLVVRRHPADDDVRVAELCVAHHRLQAVDQRCVAAPVGAQRLSLPGGGGGVQIGDDVAAAERIDRLLRIADQNHRGLPAERAVDHLPLHRVGVLELVDHHDGPAPLHARPGRRIVGLQGVREPGEQVVVVQDAELALARLQLRAHGFREVDTDRRLEAGRRVDRPQFGVCAADDLTSEVERLLAGEHRVVLLLPEMRKVQVVDDLGDHIVETLHQLNTGVGITRHPKRFQDQLTELVCGGDGRGVEAGECVAQPELAFGQLVGRAVEQMLHDLVVAGRGRVVERHQCVEDLAPHPLPQFLTGRAPEGDQQHLVQRRHTLGDIAGHEARERKRLAGARAGLQHCRRLAVSAAGRAGRRASCPSVGVPLG